MAELNSKMVIYLDALFHRWLKRSGIGQRIAFVGLLMLFHTEVQPHEFWVQPRQTEIATGERNLLDLLVGEDMNGSVLPYLPHEFDRFTVTMKSGTFDFKSSVGDRPAASYPAEEPGLHIIVYQAKPKDVRYKTLEDFEDFLDYEGLNDVLETHRKRGLPTKNFTENYSRYAKALVQVGPAQRRDTDVNFGLKYELVALENPYAADSGTLQIALFQEGEPMPGAPIAVFAKRGGAIFRELLKSNAEGKISIELKPGAHYLLNAVVMEAVEPTGPATAVWHSHWASLYFGG